MGYSLYVYVYMGVGPMKVEAPLMNVGKDNVKIRLPRAAKDRRRRDFFTL